MYTLLTYQSMETGPEFIIMYTIATILMYRLQSKISWFGSFLYIAKCKIFKHFKIKHYQPILGITRFVCIYYIERWNHTLFIRSFQSKRMDSNRTFATYVHSPQHKINFLLSLCAMFSVQMTFKILLLLLFLPRLYIMGFAQWFYQMRKGIIHGGYELGTYK